VIAKNLPVLKRSFKSWNVMIEFQLCTVVVIDWCFYLIYLFSFRVALFVCVG
jgi:hypothetical protein